MTTGPVSDSGLEVLRKSAEDLGSNTYAIRTLGDVIATPSGLRTAGRITEVTLNTSTWVALPTTPLALRNAIRIQNRTGIECKLNYDPGVAGYVGLVIDGAYDEFKDITDAIVVYGKASSGTPILVIEELS